MIVKEFYRVREDGVNLYKTYSDEYYKIRQIETGDIFDEAIDIEDAGYTYEETNEIIDYIPEPTEPEIIEPEIIEE